MKKILTLILMLSILLLLISCGNNNSYNSSNHSSYATGAPEGKLLFSTLIILLILILIFDLLLPAITAGLIADKEEFNVGHWIVASLFLGWIAVFILALLIKPKDNIIIPKTRVYKKYACKRCGELINTQKCGYCGFENSTEDLTENTTNVFGISKEDTQDWTCKCGTVNNYHNYECTVCYRPRPKK